MAYIVLGVISFVLGYLRDLAEVHKRNFIKRILGITSFIMFTFATVMLCTRSPLLALPGYLSTVGWIFFFVFAGFFAYSVFLELLLKQNVKEREAKRLVTTGTYALTRHPSAIWSILAIGFLVLASRSVYLLWAWPVWTVMELLWVWLQDRFFLLALYPEYRRYREKTPMLVPTRESIREFLAGLAGTWKSQAEGEK